MGTSVICVGDCGCVCVCTSLTVCVCVCTSVCVLMRRGFSLFGTELSLSGTRVELEVEVAVAVEFAKLGVKDERKREESATLSSSITLHFEFFELFSVKSFS